MQVILDIYRYIFCRRIFYRLNYHLQRISLRGIGVLNSEGNHVTGEEYLLQSLKDKQIKVVVDVGANAGGYTLDVREFLPNAAVYAIEPHPKTFMQLKNNVNDKKVKLYNIGLGDKNGKGTLWDFADDAVLKRTQPTSTLASTIKDVIEDFHQQKAQSFSFPILTLDTFVRK
jgi:FkbM family methyltransferase